MAAAAVPIAMAVAGGIEAKNQQKATKRFNEGAAEANRFADVTGHRTAMRQSGPGFLGGAIKGGAAGMGMGSAFSKMGGGAGGTSDGNAVSGIGGNVQAPKSQNDFRFKSFQGLSNP